MDHLIAPYGGELPQLIVSPQQAEDLKRAAFDFPSIDLDQRQLCDLELLLSGAYAPLTGYMSRADLERVLTDLQLTDGTFWPVPITLTVSAKIAETLKPGDRVALRDSEGFMPAVLTVSECWEASPERESEMLLSSGVPGSVSAPVPGSWHVAGSLDGVALPPRHDFTALRLTPVELRAAFSKRGWRRVVAYQARQPLHRAQYEFALRTAIEIEANLLIHPMAGGDPAVTPEQATLARSYQAVMRRLPSATTMLGLLPLVPHGIGTRETLLRAIVARNHGCTHLIVGGEHDDAGGRARRGVDIATHEAFRLLAPKADDIGVTLVPFPRMVYVEERAQHLPVEEVPAGARVSVLPGAEFKRRLSLGLKIPEWYSFPEVLEELSRSHPPRDKQGFTVFFTGLSGAGKSTIARALSSRLMEMGGRSITLLDGDVVRRHLSSELGFSREHRDVNVRRIGYVASEITKNRGVAICAPIAPYAATRRDVRAMIEPLGGFLEIFVSTPINTCESRDRKGLYAKARAGLIKEFTGISDPYEIPEHPELEIDTSLLSVDEAVQRILLKLEHEGYLR